MKLISLVRMLAVLTLLLSATSLFAEIEYQATAGDCSGADTSSIENCLMGDALSSPSAPVMRYCTATGKQGCWLLENVKNRAGQYTGLMCVLKQESGTCTCAWDGTGWAQQGKCDYF